MKQTIEFVCDLYFPGIGVIRKASNLVLKKRLPELHFEIAGNKVVFMLEGEVDGGTSETPEEKIYTRRLLYRPNSMFFGFYEDKAVGK